MKRKPKPKKRRGAVILKAKSDQRVAAARQEALATIVRLNDELRPLQGVYGRLFGLIEHVDTVASMLHQGLLSRDEAVVRLRNAVISCSGKLPGPFVRPGERGRRDV